MQIRHLLPCLMLATVASLHAAESPRAWTSKDGQQTLTASFFKADAEKVTLILPNGRTQAVARQNLSDADIAWVDQHLAAAAPASAAAVPSAKIPAALAGKLIDQRGNPVEIASNGGAPKYYLFYYSASWCGPCRAFTPKLVQFHRKMKARKANFEVILVPSDRSREDAIAYLKNARMPWPGLDFEHRGARGIPQSKYGFIPAMLLVDADGNQLLDVSEELSRDEFLRQAEDILNPKTAAN